MTIVRKRAYLAAKTNSISLVVVDHQGQYKTFICVAKSLTLPKHMPCTSTHHLNFSRCIHEAKHRACNQPRELSVDTVALLINSLIGIQNFRNKKAQLCRLDMSFIFASLMNQL